MSDSTKLPDELRRIADNLDRAARIGAQYCASEHHTSLIREAATRIERLEEVGQELVDLWDKFALDDGLMNPLDLPIDDRIEQIRDAIETNRREGVEP